MAGFCRLGFRRLLGSLRLALLDLCHWVMEGASRCARKSCVGTQWSRPPHWTALGRFAINIRDNERQIRAMGRRRPAGGRMRGVRAGDEREEGPRGVPS